MPASDALLVIFVIGILLLGLFCAVAIFITKSRLKAIWMGVYLVFTTLVIALIYMGMASIGAAWSGGDRPTWKWLIAPFLISSFVVSSIILLRRFPTSNNLAPPDS